MRRGSSRSGKSQPSSQVTVLAPGSALEGTIRTRGPLQVDGALCGSVTCEGTMSVSESGRILGEVRAQGLLANGYIAGLVFVRHHLQVRECGSIRGHARYETLEIARGGMLDGTTSCVSGAPTLADSDDDASEAAQ